MFAEPETFMTDQIPPGVASVNAGVCEPTQMTLVPPAIAFTTGAPSTVSPVVTVVVPQPVTEYCIVTVPAVNPVTTPLSSMLAVPVPLKTDQCPPGVASVKAGIVPLTQTVDPPPPIAATDGLVFTNNEAVDDCVDKLHALLTIT